MFFVRKYFGKLIYGLRYFKAYIRALHLYHRKYATNIESYDIEKCTPTSVSSAFTKHLKDKKISNFDYLDMCKMVDSAEPGKSDSEVYASVFLAANAMGVSLEDLTNSFYYYCGIISSFKDDIEDRITTTKSFITDQAAADLDAIKDEIKINLNSIQKLMDKNSELQKTMDHIQFTKEKRIKNLLKIEDTATTLYTTLIKDFNNKKSKCLKNWKNSNGIRK